MINFAVNFKLGMYTQKHTMKLSAILLIIIPFLSACGAIDSLMPSSSSYKVNATVNGQPLNDISFIRTDAKIRPFFENLNSNDPDIVSLIVFLRDSNGEVTGQRVIYTAERNNGNQNNSMEQNYDEEIEDIFYDELNDEEDEESNEENLEEEDAEDLDEEADNNVLPQEPVNPVYNNISNEDLIINIRNFNRNLPFFPIPKNLPIGRYTLVFQVMGESRVLHKNEKDFFYLAGTEFSFEDIQIHQSGITASSQLISMESTVMLEAKLNYDGRFDPYIVWYNGRRIIAEGTVSEGMKYLLWKAPNQNGFFSIRAEVFPEKERQGLTGEEKTISLLVSSRNQENNLINSDAPDVLNWYTFEGSIDDFADSMELSASRVSTRRPLRPLNFVSPRWMPSNGTFGLVTGYGRAYSLPEIFFSFDKDENNENNENEENNSFSILSRFLPSGDGIIYSAAFDANSAITLTLSKDDNKLLLQLDSPGDSVSAFIDITELNSFIITRVNFMVLPDRLLANLNVDISSSYNNENELITLNTEVIGISAELSESFLITLGLPTNLNDQTHNFYTIWDELVLFSVSPADLLSIDIEAETETSENDLEN